MRNKTRLLEGADFLEKIPQGVFNMAYWANDLWNEPEFSPNFDCGFAGCALGWFAHARMFGLWMGISDPKIRDDDPNLYDRFLHGYDAASKVFGISNAESSWLFSDMSYFHDSEGKISPQCVAARMRKLAEMGDSESPKYPQSLLFPED